MGKKGLKSQAGTKRAQASTSKQEKKRTSLHVVDEAFENLRKMKRKLKSYSLNFKLIFTLTPLWPMVSVTNVNKKWFSLLCPKWRNLF